MSGALTPINQLNAFPLISADSVASGGAFQVVAGRIVRFWNTAALAFPLPGQNITSAILDTRGCSQFNLAVTLTAGVGGIAAATVKLYPLVGTQAGGFPTIAATGLANLGFIGQTGFLAIANGASATFCFMWAASFALTGNSGGIGWATNRAQLILGFSAGLANVAAMSTEMWGS